jgi:hypothetical protein
MTANYLRFLAYLVSASYAPVFLMPHLLWYLATYPDNDTTYRASNMVLCVHTNTIFHNKSKDRRCTGTHIFVSENDPFTKHNGPILSISQIMEFVMFSTPQPQKW